VCYGRIRCRRRNQCRHNNTAETRWCGSRLQMKGSWSVAVACFLRVSTMPVHIHLLARTYLLKARILLPKYSGRACASCGVNDVVTSRRAFTFLCGACFDIFSASFCFSRLVLVYWPVTIPSLYAGQTSRRESVRARSVRIFKGIRNGICDRWAKEIVCVFC
jgi:hypothetical protein